MKRWRVVNREDSDPCDFCKKACERHRVEAAAAPADRPEADRWFRYHLECFSRILDMLPEGESLECVR